MQRRYTWKRYWCPPTGEIHSTPEGYPSDPTSEFGNTLNPDIVAFSAIMDQQCLILLGEPGVGKSYTLEDEFKSTIDTGRTALRIDLRGIGTESRVLEKIVDDPIFQKWRNGSGDLHLFIDSFDECLLRITHLASVLADELSQFPKERLYLRIACRTGNWNKAISKLLNQIWAQKKDDNEPSLIAENEEENSQQDERGKVSTLVKEYELVPLLKRDVKKAAEENGFDADDFLTKISRKGLVSFAVRPLTLLVLIDMYRDHQAFPSSAKELYLKGCHLLCKENNISRTASGERDSHTADHCLAVAARMAAFTVFGNRAAVWRGDASEAPETDIASEEFCGGKETYETSTIEINREAVDETVMTGLFSSRGDKRMGWSHLGHAEFLAAYYLLHHEVPTNVIKQLIVHPLDPQQGIVTKLHEAAVWLALMNGEIFQHILEHDPEVMLLGDLEMLAEDKRTNLVAAILRQYDEGTLLDDMFWGTRRLYSGLMHPGLADQLRPYIVDQSKGIVVRRVAINIAEACETSALLPELLQVALDTTDNQYSRAEAAMAVQRIGDNAAKAQLKPLAMGEAGDDPDHRLRGIGLEAVWPNSMSASELFESLEEPERGEINGYAIFLHGEFAKHLTTGDLPLALRWIAEQQPRNLMSDPFEKIDDAVLRRSLDHLEIPSVADAMTETLLTLLSSSHPHDFGRDSEFIAKIRSDKNLRRKLLALFIQKYLAGTYENIVLFTTAGHFALREDVWWVVSKIFGSRASEERAAWSEILRWTPNRNRIALSSMLITYFISPRIRSYDSFWIQLTEVFLPRDWHFSLHRKRFPMYERRERAIPEETLPTPQENEQRLDKLLAEAEGGAENWREIAKILCDTPDNNYFEATNPKISEGQLWKKGHKEWRDRILNIAKRYLTAHNPVSLEWVGTTALKWEGVAGYRALRLVAEYDTAFLNSLSWDQWAALVMVYPLKGEDWNKDPDLNVMKSAYEHSPSIVIEQTMQLLDQHNTQNSTPSFIRRFSKCWNGNNALPQALLQKMNTPELKPKCFEIIARELLKYGVSGAQEATEAFVRAHSGTTDATMNQKAVIAAVYLLRHGGNAGWPTLWPIFAGNQEFGVKVIGNIADDFYHRNFNLGERISEKEVRDLYIWLARIFPHAEDPRHPAGTAYAATTTDDIVDFRNKLLDVLRDKGTVAACGQIERIMSEFPATKEWMRWVLIKAWRSVRTNWQPLSPKQLSQLVNKEELRLVQNGFDLTRVILESLQRLEDKMRGANPASRDVWDLRDEKFRPIGEEDFSAYVARHLQADLAERGIIINREVRVRWRERTDILVNAVILKPDGTFTDSVTVVIEVKGSWNPEIKTSMKTQLLERYMEPPENNHGIYLVAWFVCEKWDDTDGRKNAFAKSDIAAAKILFAAQAKELSSEKKSLQSLVMNAAMS